MRGEVPRPAYRRRWGVSVIAIAVFVAAVLAYLTFAQVLDRTHMTAPDVFTVVGAALGAALAHQTDNGRLAHVRRVVLLAIPTADPAGPGRSQQHTAPWLPLHRAQRLPAGTAHPGPGDGTGLVRNVRRAAHTVGAPDNPPTRRSDHREQEGPSWQLRSTPFARSWSSSA